MSSPSQHSHRHSSSSSSLDHHRHRSLSPARQIHHPSSFLPHSIPTLALVESVAGGAHYSGVKVDSEISNIHRQSTIERREANGLHTEVKADHTRAMVDLKELYECHPTKEIFERSWNKDAVFQDTYSYCKGYEEYGAQWFSLPKLFSRSKTISTRVMQSSQTPNRLIYSQKQEYTYRWTGRKKIVDSIIVVDFDEHEKIISLVDQWNGKPLPTRYGAHFLRRSNAKLTPWLVKVPKLA